MISFESLVYLGMTLLLLGVFCCVWRLLFGPNCWRLAGILVVLTAVCIGAKHKYGFGAPPQQVGPLGIPPTAKQIELGRKLFFDRRLSLDGTVACATCHDPRRGWSDGLAVAVGIGNQAGTRNTPTIINSSYVSPVFWDGRVVDNVPQALLPLANPIEMGQQTEADVVTRLRLIPGYVSLFAEAFGIDPTTGQAVTGPSLARALAAFESTVVSFDAPIDRYLAGDRNALTPDAAVGFKIFEQANCTACHVPPLYTDNLMHNNGMEFAGKFQVTDQGRAGIFNRQQLTNVLRTTPPQDVIRAFKTPTLREIQRTGPYNHAGNFATLERVILHYNSGGRRFDGYVDRYLDPRIRPLNLTDAQRKYLLVFLKEAFRSPTYPMITEPSLP